MKTLKVWLSEYSQEHQNHWNQLIHKICVPLIMWTVVGFFSLLRLPSLPGGIWLSAAVFANIFVLFFYLRLGLVPFFQMLICLSVCVALCALLEYFIAKPLPWYTGVFVLAWIGQAIGHIFEGKKPSFFKDLQYLLIGPLWLLRKQ